MPKKEFNGTISLRCDDAMAATLKDIHLKHQVPPVALARGLVEAALKFYTEHGFFSFPVRIEPEAFQRQWLAAEAPQNYQHGPTKGGSPPGKKPDKPQRHRGDGPRVKVS